MIVLGLESTCDETACALVEDGVRILGQTVSTQIDLHNMYGGVVPELACRRHIDVLIPVIREALQQAGRTLEDVDLIAASYGPGLIGAIMIGLTAGKSLALALDVPFIGVNHVEAHLYGAVMSARQDIPYPALGMVISGGHTALIEMEDVGVYTLLGQTRDDAIGEAFDKAAKLLDLPYPGGPQIEKLARQGDPSAYAFKPARVKDNPFAFSFSGLKTKVLYAVKGQNANPKSPSIIDEADRAHVAAAFQQAALGDLVSKAQQAVEAKNLRSVVVGGGVANNQRLRQMMQEAELGIPLFWPDPELTLDNAAMIAGLGYRHYELRGAGDSFDLEPQPRIAGW